MRFRPLPQPEGGRRQDRRAAPPLPENPYYRIYTAPRRFEDLAAARRTPAPEPPRKP